MATLYTAMDVHQEKEKNGNSMRTLNADVPKGVRIWHNHSGVPMEQKHDPLQVPIRNQMYEMCWLKSIRSKTVLQDEEEK